MDFDLLHRVSRCVVGLGLAGGFYGVSRPAAAQPPAAAVSATPPSSSPGQLTEGRTSPGANQPPEAEDQPLAPEMAQALAEMPSDTPAAKLEAIEILLSFGQRQQARQLMDELSATVRTDQAKSQLYDQAGLATVFPLSADGRLTPTHRQWAVSVLQAGKAAGRDRDRLARLADQLATSSSPAQARLAARGLARGGSAAAAAVVERLVGEKSETVTTRLVGGLAALGRASLEPSAAVITAVDDPELLEPVLRAIEIGGDRRATIYLLAMAAGSTGPEAANEIARRIVASRLGRVPTVAEAHRELRQQAARRFQAPDSRAREEWMWTWDPAAGRLRGRSMSSHEADLVKAMRWAAEAHHLLPDDLATTSLYVACRLAVDQQLAGLDQPLRRGPGTASAEAIQAGPEVLDRALELALSASQTAAAIAACDVLAEIGDRRVVLGDRDRTAPLVAALRSPHRRVEFAAAEAIYQLAADGPYAGASTWQETVEFLAHSEGKRQILVCHPWPDTATLLAALARQSGWEPVVCDRPRMLRRIAAESADFEAILLGTPWLGVVVEEIVEQLRQDPHTADLPVAIVTTDLARQAPRWDALESVDPRTRVAATPTDVASMNNTLEELEQITPRFVVPALRRWQQALAAREWLDRQPSAAMAHRPPADSGPAG